MIEMAQALWLAVRFPFFSFETLGLNSSRDAALLVSHQQKVCAATLPCLTAGVEIGMPVSTAQLVLACQTYKKDERSDTRQCRAVCDGLYQYTPYIQEYSGYRYYGEGQRGLVLELSRCLRLFDGLDALLKKITSALQQTGFTYRLGQAQSSEAAWLLSYENAAACLENTPALAPTRDRLLALPIHSIKEFPEEIEALQQMGFYWLRDIWQQWQKEGLLTLQKRFCSAFITYLKLLLHCDTEKEHQQDLFVSMGETSTRVIYEPEFNYNDTTLFDFPVVNMELLYVPMHMMLQNLSDYLISHQQYCFGVQWVFQDIYQQQKSLDVRCEKPHRDGALLYELTLIQLEQRGLPFEVDQLMLCCPALTEFTGQTQHLALIDEKWPSLNAQDFQCLTAKIMARIGDDNVFKLTTCDEIMPESANRTVGIHAEPQPKMSELHQHAARPSWMLNTPVFLGKQQNDLRWYGKVELIRGPERLEGQWWDRPQARDYFIAMREDYTRLWIFHDLLKNEWFVHGVF